MADTSALDDLAEEISTSGLQKFCVIGHADEQGDPDYNQWLSEWRAGAVMNYLIDHPTLSGIEGLTFEASGRGSADPISDSHPENRRVRLFSVGELYDRCDNTDPRLTLE